MADNKFNSGHVVVPVFHPESGRVDHIAVDESVPLQDFHNALNDYHVQQPTAEGSFEHSAEFRNAAKRAWNLIDNGKAHAESGEVFLPSSNRGVHALSVGKMPDEGDKGGITFHPPKDAPYLLHTHNNSLQQEPSKGDIENTVKWNKALGGGKTLYLVSRSGLHSVNPDGSVTKVFDGLDWMDKK